MILSGGGRDFNVPGKNLKVSAGLHLERKQMSGFDSATDYVAAGNTKTLSVGLELPYAAVADLQALIEVAEAVTDAGDPVVYDIVDRTARGMKIRQVTFADTFQAREMETAQAWAVSFTLHEYFSVAEAVEARLAPTEVSAKTAAGTEIVPQALNAHAKLLEVDRQL